MVCKDCKFICKECLTSQHRLMVLDVCLKGQHRTTKETRRPRTRWRSLRGEKLEMFKGKMLQQAGWALDGVSNNMSNTTADTIKRVSKEVLGESKGKGSISFP